MENENSFRSLRGGGWDDLAQYLRPAYRYYDGPSSAYDDFGLRLLRTRITLNSLTISSSEEKSAKALDCAIKALKEIQEILK